MSELEEALRTRGEVEILIQDRDGKVTERFVRNAVVNTGRNALAAGLANALGGTSYLYYVNRMLFGDGGTSGGSPKVVQADRNGLFHEVFNKGVIANVDSLLPSQVVFTTVLGFDEANSTLNEIALQMASGDLYSMATFADLSKSNSIQITFNWRISFV